MYKRQLDVGAAVGHNGEVQVTRFTQLAQDYTSTSPIQSGEVAEDLAYYLYASEQVPSTISLGVLVDPDYHTVVAGGFIVQADVYKRQVSWYVLAIWMCITLRLYSILRIKRKVVY